MKHVLFVLIVVFPSTLLAQKVGDTVVVIAEKEARLKAGKDVVGTVHRGNHLRIDDVNGEWFWVNYRGTKGWVNRRDVIHLDKAIGFFTDAIRRSPTANDYNSRGILWRAKGEFDIAIEDYNEAIRLAPKYSSAYNNRGNAWKGKGEYDRAISDYNQAIRLDPKYSVPYNNRGIAWQGKGEYDRAISDYNDAIRLDPKYSTAYNNRAWLRATCPVAKYRDGKQAIKDATKACELTDWKQWVNVATLAEAYAESGDFETAVKWQKKAIELDTKDAWKEKHDRLELYKSGKPFREKPVK